MHTSVHPTCVVLVRHEELLSENISHRVELTDSDAIESSVT